MLIFLMLGSLPQSESYSLGIGPLPKWSSNESIRGKAEEPATLLDAFGG